MIGYIEKRADKRAQFTEEIKYKLISDDTANQHIDYFPGNTKNISRGGLCISVSHNISVGNVIRIVIPIDNDSRQIKAFCEVQWCKENNHGSFDIGLSFIALKEEDMEYLNEYIGRHAT